MEISTSFTPISQTNTAKSGVELENELGTPLQNSKTLQSAFQACFSTLYEHGKTFHVMAKLLGKEKGNAIAAIYHFARTVDDIVDQAEDDIDSAPDEITPAKIAESVWKIRSDLDLALHLLDAASTSKLVNSDDLPDEQMDVSFFADSNLIPQPTSIALARTIRKYDISLYPFDDLVKGVLMDLNKTRYQTYEELELYCYRVAGTIGLMITPVAGFQKASQALEYAKTLGTAFQLTNILRDVGEDLRRNRIYLPKEDLKKFGITERNLFEGRNDQAFQDLMDFQISRAFELYKKGEALIPLMTSSRGKIAFQFAIDAYSSILNKIKENNYNVYEKRAHLTFWEKVFMIPSSTFRASWLNH